MPIELRLLGTPVIQTDANMPAQDIPNTKPALLLLYLAVAQDWVSRAALASLFQSTGDDASVRRYLRVILNRARDLPWTQTLEIEAERLRFAPQTDVNQFLEAISTKRWAAAYALHQKPLLEGYIIQDAPALETWLELERERFLRAWNVSALQHAQNLSEQGNHQEARSVLERLLHHDPIQEDVVVALMRQCAVTGARQDAIRAFEKFQTALEAELGLEPMLDTVALLEQIRQSQPIPAPVSMVKNPPIASVLLHPPRLLGRENEIAMFHNSSAIIKLFLAEAGAGKTRLLEEIAPAQARWLHCREGLEGVPYQPFIEWIRANLHSIPDLGAYREDLARLIPETAPHETFGSAEPSSAKARLLEALARVFETNPAPIIIDDLQWIDQSSLEALVFMVARGKTPLIAAARQDEITASLEQTLSIWRGQNHLTEIKLKPLTFKHLQALIQDVSQVGSLGLDTEQQLIENSGGNVFFALETLRDFLERDAKDSEATLQIPSQVKHLIERRFKRLSQTTQRILQAASVMREGFTPKYLSGMIGISEFAALEALEETERAGFTNGNRFQHDLVRQSTYKSIQETRRKALHVSAAMALAKTADDMVIGNHWFEAQHLDKASVSWRLALDNLIALGSFETAKELIEQILRCFQDSETRHSARLTRAWVARLEMNFELAQQLVQAVIEENISEEMRAHAYVELSWLRFKQGRLVEALQIHQQALDIGAKFSDGFYLLGANIAFQMGEYSRSIQLLEPFEHTQNPNDRAQILSSLGANHDALGENQKALEFHRRAIEISRSQGSYRIYIEVVGNLLWCLASLNRSEEGFKDAEEALLLGSQYDTIHLRNNLAAAYFDCEKNTEAIQHYEIIRQQVQYDIFVALANARLSELYFKTRDSIKAQEALANSILFFETVEYPAVRIRIAIAVLKHGTSRQIAQISPFLDGLSSPDARTQTEFESLRQG